MILFIPVIAQAQWNETKVILDSMTFGVSANSVLFQNSGKASFEIPALSNKNMFGLSSFWMMGMNNMNVHGSMTSQNSKAELWPGPIDTVTGLPKDPNKWNSVWHVSSDQIQWHKTHFTETGYTPIKAIAEWPAKHNEQNVNPILAPFVDWNKDGIYRPEDGDYPSVPGHNNVYFIANDGAGEHLNSGTQKLGVEVQGLLYTLNEDVLSKTVFARIYVINRSPRDYAPFYFGSFSKLVLGNESDNYVGTDVGRNMVFGYNGDNMDEGFYGLQIPVSAVVFLNHKLQSSTAFNSNDSIRSLPSNFTEYKHVLEGRWRTGSAKFMHANGTETGVETQYIYPGNTDPAHTEKTWTEENSTDGPGIRNVLGIVRESNLTTGGFMQIDMAFFAGNEAIDGLSSINHQADYLIQRFGNYELSVISIDNDLASRLYPNPLKVGEVLTIESAEPINTVELIDLKGNVVLKREFKNNLLKNIHIECSEKLEAGVYIIRTTARQSISIARLLIATS